MKKMKYKWITLLSSMLLLCGCQEDVPAQIDPIQENRGQQNLDNVAYYHNNDYNDYVNAGASAIDHQWDNFGLSSPYILRHNGMYYLYCSTSSNDTLSGVRGYKSEDLMHWQPVSNGVLEDGYVVSSRSGETAKARAPEVYYYNGSFYMYESYNAGAGHFILKSSSPEGPFNALSKAVIDDQYDGTVYFGKNENPYFLTASKGYVNISTMQSMESIINTKLKVDGTDHYDDLYVESPSLFYQNGKTYLLYSTVYDKLSSYQVNYVVSDGWANETPSDLAKSFHVGATETLLYNANEAEGFTCLGHASTVLGPDLDSRYIVYDALNDAIHTNRSFNMDRLLVSGDLLTAKHFRYNSIAPKGADETHEDATSMDHQGDFYLSQSTSDNTFSCEYNFIHADGGDLVFSYEDSNNYCFLRLDTTKSIEIYAKENGTDHLLKSIDFYNYFSNDDLHSLRLAYRNGKMDVYFDDILKLADFPLSIRSGRIGYRIQSDMEIAYTAFSSMAKGKADEVDYKQSSCAVPASLFDASISTEGLSKDNGHRLQLKHNEYARYKMAFQKSSHYGIEFVISKESLGKRIALSIDDGDNIFIDIPSFVSERDEVRLFLGDLPISRGLHYFKVQGVDSPFMFSQFTFKEISAPFALSATLQNENELRGLSFSKDSRWYFDQNRLTSLSNYRNVALTSESNIADFDLSVDMSLIGSDSIFSESKEAGIVFRCDQYVDYSCYMENHPDYDQWNRRFLALRGYYLAFTPRKMSLYRLDVGLHKDVTLELIRTTAFASKAKNNVILKARGNQFDVFINRSFAASFTDDYSLSTGSCGLYTTGSEVAFQNLSIVSKGGQRS